VSTIDIGGRIHWFGLARAKFLTKEHNYFQTMMPYVLYASLTHAGYDFFLFLGGPIGPVSYVILGFLVCPTCDGKVSHTANFCPKCGTRLESA
jgi:hypothetical protein